VKRPVCLYVLGAAPEVVAAAHGPFTSWFAALWRDDPVQMLVFDGSSGAPPPDPRGLAGFVLTGSSASMTAPEPWMEPVVEVVRHAAAAGTPVLGICFGHQLIGACYGGSVVRNPRGWEVGTHEVELTPAGRADPLFRDVPDRFAANFSHQDEVEADTLAPANGVRILAGNAKTPVQAFAAGDSIRGVQFHPEIDGPIARAYVAKRYAELAADAAARDAPDEHPEHLLAGARPSPAAVQVFKNFTRNWLLKS